MRHSVRHLTLAACTVAVASALLASCKKEPLEIPEPNARTATDRYTNDSTGIEISDSILVTFGEKRWATLAYTSHIDTLDSPSGQPYAWATINARHPDGDLPSFSLVVLLQEGSHISRMSVTDPGTGHTIPGQMYRYSTGGDLYYCDSAMLRQTDGTTMSDWRPLELTTNVLDYDSYYNTLTATATGLMFHFSQWLDSTAAGSPINVADADTCRLAITFGNLRLNP